MATTYGEETKTVIELILNSGTNFTISSTVTEKVLILSSINLSNYFSNPQPLYGLCFVNLIEVPSIGEKGIYTFYLPVEYDVDGSIYIYVDDVLKSMGVPSIKYLNKELIVPIQIMYFIVHTGLNFLSTVSHGLLNTIGTFSLYLAEHLFSYVDIKQQVISTPTLAINTPADFKAIYQGTVKAISTTGQVLYLPCTIEPIPNQHESTITIFNDQYSAAGLVVTLTLPAQTVYFVPFHGKLTLP